MVPLITLLSGSAPGVVTAITAKTGLPRTTRWRTGRSQPRVYLPVDVERGEEFYGIRRADGLPGIHGRGRTPSTIHEGVALAIQFSRGAGKNRCFMLAGARRGDRRVPALWISGKAPQARLVLGKATHIRGWVWPPLVLAWLDQVAQPPLPGHLSGHGITGRAKLSCGGFFVPEETVRGR
jgi:hypothetical protein